MYDLSGRKVADSSFVIRHSSFAIFAAMMAAAAASANAPAYTLAGAGASFSSFAAGSRGARAGENKRFILGVPGAPRVLISTNAATNAWLTMNPYLPTMAIGAPTGGGSQVTDIHKPQMQRASAEGGFVFERAKPDLYLGETLPPPEGVDWAATYQDYLAQGGDGQGKFLFDPNGHRVYATCGDQRSFRWVMKPVTCTGRRPVMESMGPMEWVQ